MSQTTTRTKEQPQAQPGEHKPVAKGQCVHHWVIDAPNGRESGGTCKRCGARKSFANSTEQVMWEQTNTLRNDLNRSYRSSKSEDYTLAEES